MRKEVHEWVKKQHIIYFVINTQKVYNFIKVTGRC